MVSQLSVDDIRVVRDSIGSDGRAKHDRPFIAFVGHHMLKDARERVRRFSSTRKARDAATQWLHAHGAATTAVEKKTAAQLDAEIAQALAGVRSSHAMIKDLKWVREGSSGRSGAVHTIGQELFLTPSGSDIDAAVAWIKIVSDASGRPVYVAYVQDDRPGRAHLGRVITEGARTQGEGEPAFSSLQSAKSAVKNVLARG